MSQVIISIGRESGSGGLDIAGTVDVLEHYIRARMAQQEVPATV